MGAALRVAFVDEPPFYHMEMKNNKTIISGVSGEFFHLLQHCLNFSTDFVEPVDKVFGTYSIVQNYSTGLVRLIAERKADIIANFINENYPRSKVMSFVTIGRTKIRLYTTKNIHEGTTLHLTDIFSLQYWITLTGVITLFGVLLI